MIRSLIILLVTNLFCLTCWAQSWFSENNLEDKKKGYIIGIAGDTIEGYIKYDYPIVMQKRVTFFHDLEELPTVYKPEDIRGYGLVGKNWISIKVRMETYDGPYSFSRFGMRESIPGPLSLFRVFEEMDKKKKKINSKEAEEVINKIALTREGNSLDHIYIKKLEEPAEPVSSKEFKKSFSDKMKIYVGDYQQLMKKIESKEMELEDIDEIVMQYNKWYLDNLLK